MIRHLKMTNVGPASEMKLEFGKRLNLLTGDNGLGKSFLLDIAWWTLTRKWPGEINPKLTVGKRALPTNKKETATIDFSCSSASNVKEYTSIYQPRAQTWKVKGGHSENPGLVFYALADGSFAVWDSARNAWEREKGKGSRPSGYVFSPKEVWDGLQHQDETWICNGLIRDWSSWQKEQGDGFNYLVAVLDALSPSSSEKLSPGQLTRISLDDVRDIPTLKMPYGQDVAVLHVSSGMRRIIALAYFLVWCWEEHLKAKELLGEEPEGKAVFLIDEVESHLHPKWQRSIIPVLMRVMNQLANAFEVQLIAVTHSPLIMASVEPLFDRAQDAWFDLDLIDSEVVLTHRDFVRQGDIRSWLTSEAFDMKSGYSIEAEQLLEEAAKALSDENFSKRDAIQLDNRLRSILSDTDPFWMRWRFIAEKKGWL